MSYQDIPQKVIRLVPLTRNRKADYGKYIERTVVTRDWFDAHMYKCLPLAIANQYGYILRAPYDFSAYWTGGGGPGDVIIFNEDPDVNDKNHVLSVKSTFGRGIFTIYPGFVLKTAPDMNLLIKGPPNHIKEEVTWLEGVVETDNLNSTFSYNIRIHHPHKKISFKEGDPIGCFLPYPRFFFDDFILEVSEDPDELQYYDSKNAIFGAVRSNQITNGMYRQGTDFDGCPHHHHQKTVNKPTKEG